MGVKAYKHKIKYEDELNKHEVGSCMIPIKLQVP